MKIDKVINILENNGFWLYTDWGSVKMYSNGKVQVTILNNSVYQWEHYCYTRGLTVRYKISSYDSLNSFINN